MGILLVWGMLFSNMFLGMPGMLDIFLGINSRCWGRAYVDAGPG